MMFDSTREILREGIWLWGIRLKRLLKTGLALGSLTFSGYALQALIPKWSLFEVVSALVWGVAFYLYLAHSEKH